MNEKDIKIRKQWLGLLILNMLISAGSSLLSTWLNPALNQMPQFRYVGFSISLISSIVVGYGVYHCVYKKFGTKLLTFCLIATVLCIGGTLFLYLSGRMPLPSYIPYFSSYLIVTQILSLWWIVLCWKMLKINKRLKRLSSPVV